MSKNLGSKHDADDSLLSGFVKYASSAGRVAYAAMDMGSRIKTLREAKGLTQEELGKLLGVTRAAVSLWELGQTKNIKNVTMLQLVKLLGTTQEYLLFGPSADREASGRFRKPGASD